MVALTILLWWLKYDIRTRCLHRRPYIAPNEGFKMQMVQLEVKILGYSSVVSKAAGPDWNFYALNRYVGRLAWPVFLNVNNLRFCVR